jgi:hypothetical protein
MAFTPQLQRLMPQPFNKQSIEFGRILDWHPRDIGIHLLNPFMLLGKEVLTLPPSGVFFQALYLTATTHWQTRLITVTPRKRLQWNSEWWDSSMIATVKQIPLKMTFPTSHFNN